MSLDGSTFEVADEKSNEDAFSRPGASPHQLCSYEKRVVCRRLVLLVAHLEIELSAEFDSTGLVDSRGCNLTKG